MTVAHARGYRDKRGTTGKPVRSRERRSLLLCLVLACALAAVTVRLFTLQVREGRHLAERATRQYQRLVPLISKRGTIRDRNGRELAVSLTVSSIFAQPRQVTHRDEVARTLAPLVGVSSTEILRKLSHNTSFVWIRRRVDPVEATAVERLGLPGIYLVPEAKRYYPQQELAAHVLGFVGEDDKGLEGVEFQYDEALGGKPQWVVRQQDALGRPLFRGESRQRPHDLTVTVDQVIQYVAERELTQAVALTGARAGTVIVMDPMTGQILALANSPTFNPNRFTHFPAVARRNSAITDFYEPGSAFKIVMAAAALEEGIVRPRDRFYGEGGVIQVEGVTIRDHEKYGWLTFEEVMAQSSNVGAIKVGLKMGKSLYYSHISGFGFGSITGVDLPGETPGLIRRPHKWTGLSLSSLSIGQEISVTPLQMITAFSAVANGGYLVRPYLAKSLWDPEGRIVHETTPLYIRRVISEETARTLTAILTRAVTEGTGKAASVPGYTVAGKTGTSQKSDPATGRYSHDKVIASFAGYVPAEQPRLAILVVIDEPRELAWGATAAAPVFREIAREALAYLKVSPAPPENKARFVRAAYRGPAPVD